MSAEKEKPEKIVAVEGSAITDRLDILEGKFSELIEALIQAGIIKRVTK